MTEEWLKILVGFILTMGLAFAKWTYTKFVEQRRDLDVLRAELSSQTREGNKALWAAHNELVRDTNLFKERAFSEFATKQDVRDTEVRIINAIQDVRKDIRDRD